VERTCDGHDTWRNEHQFVSMMMQRFALSFLLPLVLLVSEGKAADEAPKECNCETKSKPPSGSWMKTARAVSVKPLVKPWSMVKAQLRAADMKTWKEAEAIFRDGDEFANADGTFERPASLVEKKSHFAPSQEHLNIWEIIVVMVPLLCFPWAAIVKELWHSTKMKLLRTEDQLERAKQVIGAMSQMLDPSQHAERGSGIIEHVGEPTKAEEGNTEQVNEQKELKKGAFFSSESEQASECATRY